MTTVGYGDKAPRTVGGRAVGFIWMFTAIIVISFFTATIASSLTLTRLHSRVGGPQDLPHVRVGGLEGSAAVEYLEEQGIRGARSSTFQETRGSGRNDGTWERIETWERRSRGPAQRRPKAIACGSATRREAFNPASRPPWVAQPRPGGPGCTRPAPPPSPGGGARRRRPGGPRR